MGFEGRTAVIPLSIGFAGLLVASLFYTFFQFPLVPTFLTCLAPGAVATLLTLFFVNHKPAGYLPDYVRSILGRAGSSHFRPRKPSPYHSADSNG